MSGITSQVPSHTAQATPGKRPLRVFGTFFSPFQKAASLKSSLQFGEVFSGCDDKPYPRIQHSTRIRIDLFLDSKILFCLSKAAASICCELRHRPGRLISCHQPYALTGYR